MIYIFHKVNRELTERAFANAKECGFEPHIIDNSEGYDFQAWGATRLSPKTFTFAAMHNWMLGTVGSYYWMHNDVIAPQETYDKLRRSVDSRTDDIGAVFADYDRLCWFNGEAFKKAGYWDLVLPQYYSDNDIYRRVRLAGYQIVELNLPLTHDYSNSLLDPKIQKVHSNTFDLYGEYYRRKWGALHPNEHYQTPFNV